MRLLQHEPTGGDPHPQVDAATLIPRLVLGQERLVGTFFERGFRTVAAPLYFSDVVAQLTLGTRPEESGLVLDPTTHLRQRLPDERASSFRALPYGDDPEPFDPDESKLSNSEIEQLALGPPDLQRSAGATLILTTYHVVGAVGTRGRELDLLLARLAVEHFRDQRFNEPPKGALYSFPRRIYATIATPLEVLRSEESARLLAERYLGIPADGFWIKLLGFDERASLSDIEAAGRFFSFMREGGRPVVSCGPGQLVLGFLVDEFSASIGIAGHERFKYPEPWRPPSDGQDATGRSRPVYSPHLLRSLLSHDDRIHHVFERAPCRCGAHQPSTAPSGGAVDLHTGLARAAQATDALDGDRLDRREWLAALAERATQVAGDLGLPRKPIEPPYRALLDGLDDREGRQQRLSDAG